MKLDVDPRLPVGADVPRLISRLYEVLRLIARANNLHSDGYVGGGPPIQTADYTVQDGDTQVLISAAGGARVLTLQEPGRHFGKTVACVKTEGSANVVTITPPSGTINGAGTLNLTAAARSRLVVSDGTNFFTIP